MRLLYRNRHQRPRRTPVIAITQAEITADLHYPASRRARQVEGADGVRRGPAR